MSRPRGRLFLVGRLLVAASLVATAVAEEGGSRAATPPVAGSPPTSIEDALDQLERAALGHDEDAVRLALVALESVLAEDPEAASGDAEHAALRARARQAMTYCARIVRPVPPPAGLVVEGETPPAAPSAPRTAGSAPDARPYWQRQADRLVELSPPPVAAARRRVAESLEALDFLAALDAARAARGGAESGNDALFAALETEVLATLDLPAAALMRASELEGESLVFRLADGSTITGAIHAVASGTFRVRTVDGLERDLDLADLSPVGLVQIVLRTGSQPPALISACHLLLLVGEDDALASTLARAREKGIDLGVALERALAVAQEVAILEAELPAAIAQWQTVEEALAAAGEARRQANVAAAHAALGRLVAAARSEDRIEIMARARAQEVDLGALVTWVRRTCQVDHRVPDESLVTCGECDGRGRFVTRQVGTPFVLGREREVECPICGGDGLVVCALCSERSQDEALRGLAAWLAESPQ